MAVRVCSTQLDHASDLSAGRHELGMASDQRPHVSPAQCDWHPPSGRDRGLSDEQALLAGFWPV